MTDHAGTVIGGARRRGGARDATPGSQRSKTNCGAAQSSPITRTRLAIPPTLVARQPELVRCETGELTRGQADAAALAHGVDDLEIEPVPPARARPVEALRMPQDRKPAA